MTVLHPALAQGLAECLLGFLVSACQEYFIQKAHIPKMWRRKKKKAFLPGTITHWIVRNDSETKFPLKNHSPLSRVGSKQHQQYREYHACIMFNNTITKCPDHIPMLPLCQTFITEFGNFHPKSKHEGNLCDWTAPAFAVSVFHWSYTASPQHWNPSASCEKPTITARPGHVLSVQAT